MKKSILFLLFGIALSLLCWDWYVIGPSVSPKEAYWAVLLTLLGLGGVFSVYGFVAGMISSGKKAERKKKSVEEPEKTEQTDKTEPTSSDLAP